MAHIPIILPSETQNREFDAKLLLAGMLAERGHPVWVGSRMEIHKQVHRLPRGLYLAKDINRSSTRILQLFADLGFGIAAWDEEAISIIDIPTFQARRIGPGNMRHVRGIFAWGEQNVEAIQSHDEYAGQPVWVTGNPRTDLLRPALRGYFSKAAEGLRARYGDFILINSNFGRLNHFLEHERAHRGPDGAWVNVGIGSPEWWEYRSEVLDSFKQLLPALAARYPERTIVVRPHPSEAPQMWQTLSAGHKNVVVVHEGAVHPWIMASAVAIHNMCTTGVESYLLDHEVITYEAVSSAGQRPNLANALSRSVETQDSLFACLDDIFDGRAKPYIPPAEAVEQLEYEMGPLSGALASERIDAIISEHIEEWMNVSQSSVRARLRGHWGARIRKASKVINGYRKGHKNSHAYTRSRWPGMMSDDVAEKLDLLRGLTGRFGGVQVEMPMPDIFKLSTAK